MPRNCLLLFLYCLKRLIFSIIFSLKKKSIENWTFCVRNGDPKARPYGTIVDHRPVPTWETEWRDDRRPSIRARWKQSKRFNFGRRCNITVPSEMESQPRASWCLPARRRLLLAHDDDDNARGPYPNCSGGQRRLGASHTRPSHALRMNLDVHSWAWSAQSNIISLVLLQPSSPTANWHNLVIHIRIQ